MKIVFVTGGAGFIGSAFVRMVLNEQPDVHVVDLDALTYAGNLENLKGIDESRHTFIKGDICDRELVMKAIPADCDAVFNFAAESHVDRSINSADEFLRTNVIGTQVLLDAARAKNVRRFVQVSTDEVMGSLPDDSDEYFTESSPLQPNSPYAASKAAAEFVVRAARETHSIDTVVTRCGNNYGPRQFPEKLIPLMLANAMNDDPLPVYGDGKNVRDWIYVDDAASLMTTYATTLVAISAGAVFMGANSYIGNAPNIMVKSIAESRGVPMPSFFAYVGWALLVLGPIYVLLTFLFFR